MVSKVNEYRSIIVSCLLIVPHEEYRKEIIGGYYDQMTAVTQQWQQASIMRLVF